MKKKNLFAMLLTLPSLGLTAKPITISGTLHSAAGANWYFEGYPVTNGQQFDCKTLVNFSYTPNDGYRSVKLSKTTEATARKLEDCPNGDTNNGKICIINAEVKPSKDTTNGFDIVSVSSVKVITGKVACE